MAARKKAKVKAKSPAKPKPRDIVLSTIREKFGEEAIMLLDPTARALEVPRIPSGSIGLDKALGCKGWPLGRIVEVYGPESSGKTTMALHAIVECQKLGKTAAFVDAEHALDIGYAQDVGVDLKKLYFSQPTCGEQALDMVEHLCLSGHVDLIVVDSVAALTPQAEIDAAMDQQFMGLQARMMSKAMRKLTAVASKNQVCIIFINQIRMKIGVMFGSPEVTPGGGALKFYASMRIDVRRRAQLKGATEKDDAVGNHIVVKVVKNKLAPPFRSAELDIIWGHGIDQGADLLNVACCAGVIEKHGSWFAYQGERLAQGFNNTKTKLMLDSELSDNIRTETLETF